MNKEEEKENKEISFLCVPIMIKENEIVIDSLLFSTGTNIKMSIEQFNKFIKIHPVQDLISVGSYHNDIYYVFKHQINKNNKGNINCHHNCNCSIANIFYRLKRKDAYLSKYLMPFTVFNISKYQHYFKDIINKIIT